MFEFKDEILTPTNPDHSATGQSVGKFNLFLLQHCCSAPRASPLPPRVPAEPGCTRQAGSSDAGKCSQDQKCSRGRRGRVRAKLEDSPASAHFLGDDGAAFARGVARAWRRDMPTPRHRGTRL